MSSLTTEQQPSGGFMDDLGTLFLDVQRAKLIDVQTHEDDNNVPGAEDVRTGRDEASQGDMYGGIFSTKNKSMNSMLTLGLTLLGVAYVAKKVL